MRVVVIATRPDLAVPNEVHVQQRKRVAQEVAEQCGLVLAAVEEHEAADVAAGTAALHAARDSAAGGRVRLPVALAHV